MDHPLFIVLLVVALAFANGTNDVSKAIATLVGSGITHYRTAIIWGSVWTVLGASASGLVATAMVTTFSKGLLQPDVAMPMSVAPSVMAGAITWVLIASRMGWPVSTTHALIGAIVGSGLAAFGSHGLLWSAIVGKVVLPLLLSPFLALLLSAVTHSAIRALAARWKGACLCLMPASRALIAIDAQGAIHRLFQTTIFGTPTMDVPARCDPSGLSGLVIGPDTIHWVSSGLTSLARGTNDAPKIVAILLLGGSVSLLSNPSLQAMAFVGVAVAMGLGSFIGGLRVTEVLAERVTRMDHIEGLSANLTTSSLVLVSSTLGLPVSTTHVSSSAIVGIGLLKGIRAVRWSTVRDMVLAWVVTLPAAAMISSLTYFTLMWIW